MILILLNYYPNRDQIVICNLWRGKEANIRWFYLFFQHQNFCNDKIGGNKKLVIYQKEFIYEKCRGMFNIPSVLCVKGSRKG